MTTKISAGIVVTANDRMDVSEPGYVIVRDGLIVEAGPGSGPEGAFDELVAVPRRIVMPGLVNGHAHSPSNLLKGSWAQLPLEIWRQYIRAGWREYSDEAIYVSAQIGLIEMIRTGCTSVMDHFYTGSLSPHMGALHAVAAMADAGMRGGLALTLSDQQYDATVGLDTGALSQAARDEVTRISALEGKNPSMISPNSQMRCASAPISCRRSSDRRRRIAVRSLSSRAALRLPASSTPWSICTCARPRASSCRDTSSSAAPPSLISIVSAR